MKITDVLLEFAPGDGESGRWYTDDQMTDIVGDGWWQDLDISDERSKQGMIQEAQAWLEDQGYSVQVLNVKVNDDDCDWFIQGSFDNPGFANEGMAEDAEPIDREFALVKKLGRLGERIVQNPRLWDRYDEAIDNENIDWVIGLIQDGTGATASEVTKLADLFGEIGGGLGRIVDFAWAVKEGTWDKDFMNPYRAHRSQGPDQQHGVAEAEPVPGKYSGHFYDAVVLPNGDYQVVKINSKAQDGRTNPLNLEVGAVVPRGQAHQLQYQNDGGMFDELKDSSQTTNEGKPKEKEADYGDDYQDMVARVKKLAGMGPLKTVWDPQKRVYRNVPTAVQPKK